MIKELKKFFETLFFALMLVSLVIFTPGNGGLLLLFYLLCSILFQFGLLSFQLNIFIFMVVNIFFIIIIYIFSSKNSKDFDKEDFPYLLGAYSFIFLVFIIMQYGEGKNIFSSFHNSSCGMPIGIKKTK